MWEVGLGWGLGLVLVSGWSKGNGDGNGCGRAVVQVVSEVGVRMMVVVRVNESEIN